MARLTFRSARLEAILGNSIDLVTYEQIVALVGNANAAEAYDLDYKRNFDGDGDRPAKKLVKVIASLANHAGGLIIVGMAEVDGIPSAAVPFDANDKFEGWVRQSAASRIAPLPRFDIELRRGPTGYSFALIGVHASPSRPHAIFAANEEGYLQFPRRHGRTTHWLSEVELESEYRDRSRRRDRSDRRIMDLETSALDLLVDREQFAPVMSIVLVPDEPGRIALDGSLFDLYSREILSDRPMVGNDFASPLKKVKIGQKRLIVESSVAEPDYRTELYLDGSGVWTVRIYSPAGSDHANLALVRLDALIYDMLSALHFLGRHARNRAGVSGAAQVQIGLWSSPLMQDEVYQRNISATLEQESKPLALLQPNGPDRGRIVGTDYTHEAVSTTVALVDDLADGTVRLMSAVREICTDLVHAFGFVELPHFAPDGSIYAPAWVGPDARHVRTWAEQQGIPVIDGPPD